MSADRDLHREAVEYFQHEPGFARLCRALAKKYQTLGRWGGKVTLSDVEAAEQKAFSSFFREDYTGQTKVTVSLEQFSQALAKTKFADVPVLSLLAGVLEMDIQTKSDILAAKEQAWVKYWRTLSASFPEPCCQTWLKAIMARQPGTRSVQAAYEEDPEALRSEMEKVLTALQELPVVKQAAGSENSLVRLPVFALRITGDPHGLDLRLPAGRLLRSALGFLRQQDGDTGPELASGAEALTELYYAFGLLRDDLWNFVTCSGILAWSQVGDILPVWQAAAQSGSVLNAPLREVAKVGRAEPCCPSLARGGALESGNPVNAARTEDTENLKCAKNAQVFIVENPAVFSSLLDRWEEGHTGGLPLVCTHGQFKLAAWLLLDKLASAGARLWYSGDFDPEGVLIAERLLQRYPGQARLWHYGVADYLKCLSDQTIAAKRLAQLEKIQAAELLPLRQEMERRGFAGYQEGLIEDLWQDIALNLGYATSQRNR